MVACGDYLRRAAKARPPAPRPISVDHNAICSDIAYPSSSTPVAGNVGGTTTVVVVVVVGATVVVVAAIVVVVAGATVVVVGGATVVVVGAGSDVHESDVEPSSPVINMV